MKILLKGHSTKVHSSVLLAYKLSYVQGARAQLRRAVVRRRAAL